MAVANVLTIGTAAGNSADLVVATGAILVLGLKTTNGGFIPKGVNIHVTMKDDAAHYNVIGRLTDTTPTIVLQGEGTYRVERVANSVSIGVFSG